MEPMGKLSRKDLEEIVERDLPGSRLVEKAAGQDPEGLRAGPEEVTPDVAMLRRKYLGTDEAEAGPGEEYPGGLESGAEADAGTAADEDGDDDADDAEIVAVEPAAVADPLDRGSRAKSVVVSSRDRKIIGSQG